MRRAVVGVMGSGGEPWEELAVPLGALVADLGFHLLTGGGAGVMESVSRGFCSRTAREGLCLGVLPCEPDGAGGFRPKRGYPNRWVELAIRSPLSSFGGGPADTPSRNQINVLTSDALVILPGSRGTRNEAELALGYHTPAIGCGPAEAFSGFPEALDRVDEPDDARDFLERFMREREASS